MPLLLDLENLTCCQTDSALEFLWKALSEERDDAIWLPHQDPWIAEIVERFTQDALEMTDSVSADARRVLGALMKAPPSLFAKAESWTRWSSEHAAEIARQIDAIPPAARTLDDWMLVVDLIIHRWMPDGRLRDMGEYLAVRAQLAGIVRARMGQSIPDDRAARIASILPSRIRDVDPAVITERQAFTIRVAVADACTFVREVADKVRNKMRQIVSRWVKRITLGDAGAVPDKLKQELLDAFGPLNRDWRRIAVTETGNATLEGFIAALEPGTRVRRMEAYTDPCDFCASIRGRVLTVVAPDKEPKDWDTEVWVGKNNIGRSASPRKRIGSILVPREPEEMWSIPAGTVHPHCRGSWVVETGKPAAVSKEFDDWARGLLAATAPKEK